MIYEHRYQRPISTGAFIARMLAHGGFALLLVVVSVAIGTVGYHHFAEQPLLDAFLNACMLLGGMGPVGQIEPSRGKLFAALFALYAGLVFLVATALLLTPIFHRVLHVFHWDADQAGAMRPREPRR